MGTLEIPFALGGPSPRPAGSSYFRVGAEPPIVVTKELTDALLASADTYRDRTVVPYLATELASAKDPVTVYTCGPDAMMAAVARICAAAKVPCEVSLETPMACGYGVCLGCPVPKQGGGFLYACTEGPCVDAARIAWSR